MPACSRHKTCYLFTTFLSVKEQSQLGKLWGGVGHPQPATRVRAGNATAKGFANNTIKIKRSKTFDWRPWWLKGRGAQGQSNVIWEAGTYNLAGYPTKHHLPPHHKNVRPTYLHKGEHSPTTLQGCNEILRKKARPSVLAALRAYHPLLARVKVFGHNLRSTL